MLNKLQQFGLLVIGVLIGVSISLTYSAVAQRAGLAPLPVEEMRAFTDVFEAIKRNYVEPVEDKKLFTEAINGMLTGLDPLVATGSPPRTASPRRPSRVSLFPYRLMKPSP